MPRLKKPRDPEQTRKIIRALRDRFFSEEAKKTVEREMAKVERKHAAEVLAERAPDRPPAPRAPISEGDEFSADERERAWAILHVIRQTYGPEAGGGGEEGDGGSAAR